MIETQLRIAIVLSCIAACFQLQAQEKHTEIRYYGTACFTIQRGDNVLLTDPFISNPPLAQLMFGKVKTDVAYVEKFINPATFRNVKMVIAGHAHYDHLLDLPYLSKYLSDSTILVGNKTAKHILAYYKLPQPMVVVNDSLGTDSTLGKWIYSADSTMRTMAFKSMHPPHFAGLNLLNKRYASDLKSEPLLMADWQEGKTVAYLVDWIKEGIIAYRAYFSSSLAKAPFGLFPKEIIAQRKVDDMFLSAALFNDFDKAPKPHIDLVQPKRILLMHWENFFRSKEKSTKPIDASALQKLLTQLKTNYPTIEVIQAQPLQYY